MLHIYYGMGKGKTSTLNGSTIRAKGAGFKVFYVKFLKGRISSEDAIIAKTVDKFLRVQSSEKFVIQMDPTEKFKAKDEVEAALKFIKMNYVKYDVLIFDEIIDLTADNVNLITVEKLKEFLNNFKDKEVLISGHSLPKLLEEMSDLITKYTPEKHYFEIGQKARKGIEF